MSNVFYVADLHLAHTNCAKWRGFNNEEVHDDWIVTIWNNRVSNRDTVYVLGDVCMHKRGLVRIKELRGRKVLVMGNHDEHRSQLYLEAGFDKLCGAIDHSNWILSHVPLDISQKARWKLNVHGHTHSKRMPDPWHYCVSIEQFGGPVAREYIETCSHVKHKGE